MIIHRLDTIRLAIIFALLFIIGGFGILSAAENEYQNLLDHQRLMTTETWKKLKSQGVTEETKLSLEFFYYASSKDAAEKYMRHLLEYEYAVKIKPEKENAPSGLWVLTGHTQPTQVNEKILLKWVDYMVTSGWKFGCVFDGWGTEIP